MRLVFASDHAAVDAREALAAACRAAGHAVEDVGTYGSESVDYPDFAYRAARAVAAGEADRGVLLCGTGIGVCIAANKVPGIRAAVLSTPAAAEMSRRHNDANVACFGARLQSLDEMRSLLTLWLATPFDAGRHVRRVAKLDAGAA